MSREGAPTPRNPSAGRRALLVLAALTIGSALSSCSTNEQDRAFFQDGWMHPEEGADRRMNSSTWH